MTLLQIKYLAAVCETGNVSKAANDLFVFAADNIASSSRA